MKRLVFISNMAAPYQVKLCHELQQYYDAEFWFHVQLEKDRPDWWRVPLGRRNRILPRVVFRECRRYFSFQILEELDRLDPDIVLIGGLALPSNAIAYLWAKAHRRTVVAFTEVRRSGEGVPRRIDAAAVGLRMFYAGLDAIMTSAPEATEQFGTTYGFETVVTAQYPADLDRYFDHPTRRGGTTTLLFPNRLVDLYDPLKAISIFVEARRRYGKLRLHLNGSGPLRSACETLIRSSGVEEGVSFLDSIGSWDDLPKAYASADVMILPARFSAGNFTIVEAMASGMGIVISDKIQGYGGLIRDGENGFRREPSVEAFVDAVGRYVMNPALYETHAHLNRELVRPYTIRQTAKLWASILESVPVGGRV